MSRPPRIFAYSQIYHIILKGIDGQNIFYDNQDRNFFLEQISITKQNFNYAIYSYCLMSNHVHMVIKCNDEALSKAIQSLSIRYVCYFNHKYERNGTLFQGRFKSKNVETQKYFIDLCRYIHRNPEKAGICLTQNYAWSSYKEYLGKAKIIDKKLLLHYFNNNLDEFVYYTTQTADIDNIEDFIEYELINRLTDAQLIAIILKKFGISDIKQMESFFKNKPKDLLNKDLQKIKLIKGTTKAQIARILRINRKFLDNLYNS